MGKGKPKFKPSQQPNKGAKITSHGAPSGSTNHLSPIFNLQYLRGPYCLSECCTNDKAAFADTSHKLSKLTWGEIQKAPKHGSGHEIIARSALGNRAYPHELTEDLELLAFRFSGKAPMVGYRIGRTFTVLFLDRNCTLYDHGG